MLYCDDLVIPTSEYEDNLNLTDEEQIILFLIVLLILCHRNSQTSMI